jgi:hypothetical protein
MPICELFLSKLSDTENKDDENYTIPLDLGDIMSICREYADLGGKIQTQIESILENGISDSIKSGSLQRASLPHIKNFLKQIIKNPYFGEATSQANDCIYLIDKYEDENFQNKILLN